MADPHNGGHGTADLLRRFRDLYDKKKTNVAPIIWFDGPDGVGKTTQSQRFARWLSDVLGQPVPWIPNQLKSGWQGEFRELLFENVSDMSNRTEALQMLALHSMVHDEIHRQLDEGAAFVVVDRWVLSFWAYQLIGKGIHEKDPEFTRWTEWFAEQLTPLCGILMTGDSELLDQRMLGRPGAKEVYERDPDYVLTVRQAYLNMRLNFHHDDVPEKVRKNALVHTRLLLDHQEAGNPVTEDEISSRLQQQFHDYLNSLWSIAEHQLFLSDGLTALAESPKHKTDKVLYIHPESSARN